MPSLREILKFCRPSFEEKEHPQSFILYIPLSYCGELIGSKAYNTGEEYLGNVTPALRFLSVVAGKGPARDENTFLSVRLHAFNQDCGLKLSVNELDEIFLKPFEDYRPVGIKVEPSLEIIKKSPLIFRHFLGQPTQTGLDEVEQTLGECAAVLLLCGALTVRVKEAVRNNNERPSEIQWVWESGTKGFGITTNYPFE